MANRKPLLEDRERLLRELEFLAAAEEGRKAGTAPSPEMKIGMRWMALLTALGLGIGLYAELVEVVAEGQWRTCADIGTFLAKRTRWFHERAERGPRQEVVRYRHPGTLRSQDGGSRNESLDLAAERTVENDTHQSLRVKGLPEKFTTIASPPKAYWDDLKQRNQSNAGVYGDDEDCEGPLRPRVEPNWEKIAIGAGLGKREGHVLAYRSRGIGRTAALEAQPDDASRKAFQAAWRRLHRGQSAILDLATGGASSVDAGGMDEPMAEHRPNIENSPQQEAFHEYLTLEQASKLYRVPQPLLLQWVASGRIPVAVWRKPLFDRASCQRIVWEKERFAVTTPK